MSKVILGGGLGGLSAAYYLSKGAASGQNITVIEASKRLGGWIKSNLQGGVLFEQGPRTIRPRGEAGQNTLELIEELDIGDKIIPIPSTDNAAKNRLIYANKSLHLLPSSLGGLLRKQEPFSKPLIFHLMNDLKAKRKLVEDESIYDFINRRFGSEVADYLISPLICGICAGNSKEISVNFLLKQFFEYEQQHGSITGGLVHNLFTKKSSGKAFANKLNQRVKNEKWNVYSFAGGCEMLPKELEKKVSQQGVQFKLDHLCKEISIESNKVIVHCDNGSINAEHLISSIPAKQLGMLLEKQHPDLAVMLKKINSVSVAVVNLQFKGKLLASEAFGVLVAPKENLPILGVIYDSCCFPETHGKDNTVLTVMMGGFWFEQHFGKDPSENVILRNALEQLKHILKITDEPSQYKVNILKECLPQYVVGHNDNLARITHYINSHKLPISLCGASYYGVGVNDVILSAKNAVVNLNGA